MPVSTLQLLHSLSPYWSLSKSFESLAEKTKGWKTGHLDSSVASFSNIRPKAWCISVPRKIIYTNMKASLLLPMCHRSKKWSMRGFPNSWHFLGQSCLIHFAIDWWRSEMKDLIIIPVASKKAKAFWCAKNSMLELLPASLACKTINLGSL